MGNIILYWMRWTWKSSLWKLLSIKLNKNFIDLDKYIIEKIWDITEYVAKNSWDDFRDMEHKYLKEVLENNFDIVLSLWGGTIIFERNSNLILKNNSKLIYINSSLENISQRIESDEKSWNKRTSLTWKSLLDELSEVYEKRKDIYEKFYDFKVDNNSDMQKTLDEILGKINYWNICIPITSFDPPILTFPPRGERNLKKQIEVINNDNKIKFVELRIDFLDDLEELNQIIPQIKKQIILTNRTKNEWWKFEWNDELYFEIIKKYWNLVEYVDVELGKINIPPILTFPPEGERNNRFKLIISYHNFEKTPSFEELVWILENMKKYSPDVYKLAIMPKNESDVEIVYRLSNYFKQNYVWEFIFISMWELWKETRVKIPKMWWILSFWVLTQASAPGQIEYRELYEKIFNN